MANNGFKDRGIFLTILTLYGAIDAIMVFFSGIIYPITGMGLPGRSLSLILLVTVLEFIPLVAGLYGIWKWKKWGIYSLGAGIVFSILATFVSDIVLKLFTGYAQYVIAFDILEAAIWFWALYRKRSYFK